MSLLLRHALAWAVVLPAATAAQAQTPWPPVPALSAHRGASALYPEMTQPAFVQALQDGADLLELDVVLSKDGVPVVRHDAALAAPEVGEGTPFATTDVATRPEFAQRKTTKTVDGVRQTGWFAEDFTLQELKTLRTVERFAQLRPGSAAHDGQYPLLTLQEVADLAKAHTARTGRTAGLLIELKHAAYLQAQGLDLGRALLEFLERNQWSSAQAPVIVQSFEVQVLKELRARSPVRILQLLGGKGGPPDRATQGATYAQMASAQGMAAIAAYAQGVALPRQLAMAMD
jgi:glycerophosphoryl diester phosphodiesterase